jgi:hypothetical protein
MEERTEEDEGIEAHGPEDAQKGENGHDAEGNDRHEGHQKTVIPDLTLFSFHLKPSSLKHAVKGCYATGVPVIMMAKETCSTGKRGETSLECE